VNKSQHRIVSIFPADGHPLFDGSEVNVHCLVNTSCGVNRILPRDAGAQERKHIIKLAIFRVKGWDWGCGRRLLALGDLPKHPKTQTDERKVTNKDASDHAWLRRDV
jgi:hypothetical protein